MTDPAPWSLTRRVAVLLCVLSVLPVVVATVVGASLLSGSIERELEALAREEYEEARSASFGVREPVHQFETVAARLASEHPSVRLGWRVRSHRTDSAPEDFGESGLLAFWPGLGTDAEPTPTAPPAPHVQSLGDGVYGIHGALTDSSHVTLVLDGALHFRSMRLYWIVAAVSVGTSLLLSLAAARFLARHLARLLSGVTDRLEREPDAAAETDHRLPLELQPIANELQRLLDEVRARAAETQWFTAGLAHELRSPIQNLVGQAEVALLQPRAATDYAELLTSQLEELHEFADAVDNLLHLCAVDEPARISTREEFDLGVEVGLRLQPERRRAAAKQVALRFESSGDLELRGDREAILRAVRNVLGNAVKWAPTGTEVSVRLDGTDAEIRVEVTDRGPGVPEAERESVFTPFAQGSAPRGERTGFGLGLAIVRTAVEQHGGTARIEAGPHGGARVVLTIPRCASAVGADSTNAPGL